MPDNITHDSQIPGVQQYARECMRPFKGHSQRHLRRKYEALVRKAEKAAAKAQRAANITEEVSK